MKGVVVSWDGKRGEIRSKDSGQLFRFSLLSIEPENREKDYSVGTEVVCLFHEQPGGWYEMEARPEHLEGKDGEGS